MSFNIIISKFLKQESEIRVNLLHHRRMGAKSATISWTSMFRLNLHEEPAQYNHPMIIKLRTCKLKLSIVNL